MLPIVAAWDRHISALRVYSPQELRTLVRELAREDYTWQVGQQRTRLPGVALVYVLGMPTTADAAAGTVPGARDYPAAAPAAA